ncbi:hypothetical protein OC842_007444 [Tilletia horrida]|uniref:Uncharacterized protein n=1 Tax=Tilletia horrida TaxID=155126 RepID=A0AAN6G637_9BASI|nr:hypothetical protein OC842_007444 [Tilletia horrida]
MVMLLAADTGSAAFLTPSTRSRTRRSAGRTAAQALGASIGATDPRSTDIGLRRGAASTENGKTSPPRVERQLDGERRAEAHRSAASSIKKRRSTASRRRAAAAQDRAGGADHGPRTTTERELKLRHRRPSVVSSGSATQGSPGTKADKRPKRGTRHLGRRSSGTARERACLPVRHRSAVPALSRLSTSRAASAMQERHSCARAAPGRLSGARRASHSWQRQLGEDAKLSVLSLFSTKARKITTRFARVCNEQIAHGLKPSTYAKTRQRGSCSTAGSTQAQARQRSSAGGSRVAPSLLRATDRTRVGHQQRKRASAIRWCWWRRLSEAGTKEGPFADVDATCGDGSGHKDAIAGTTLDGSGSGRRPYADAIQEPSEDGPTDPPAQAHGDRSGSTRSAQTTRSMMKAGAAHKAPSLASTRTTGR